MNRRLLVMVAAVVLVMVYVAYSSCGCEKAPEEKAPEEKAPEDDPSPVQLSEQGELAALPLGAKLAPGAVFETPDEPYRINACVPVRIDPMNTDTIARQKIMYNK